MKENYYNNGTFF